ncbi:MAG: DUF523 domain-containing protein [Candidatus Aenigmatarchaeota archaeon]
MKIVSACLAGINCKYNGKNNLNKKVLDMVRKGEAIPVCPEQLGGLTTPREPAYLTKSGEYVLKNKAKVFSEKGEDLTKFFVKGAREVLRIAKLLRVKEAILKARSPSCGFRKTWINKKVRKGNGVTAALLSKNGIKIYTEEDLNEKN